MAGEVATSIKNLGKKKQSGMKVQLSRILVTVTVILVFSHSPESLAQEAGCPLQREVVQSAAICPSFVRDSPGERKKWTAIPARLNLAL